jgi:hypothetical protein
MIFYPRGSFPPVSNAQRQREFRRRHPDYNRQQKAKFRARVREYQAMKLAERAAASVKIELPAPILMLPAPPPRLMLPAPVEVLVIPGMNTISRATLAAAQPVLRESQSPESLKAA